MFMSDVHSFTGNIKKSDEHNRALDAVFSQWYEIHRMPLEVDKLGIDRIWREREWKVYYTVEYKADDRTAETGNAFVETVSVDTKNKPGWGYTCAAQILVYYIPQWNKAYLLSPMTIKEHIQEWREKYREVSAQNNGYKTLGIAVPFDVFKKYCYAVVDIAGAT